MFGTWEGIDVEVFYEIGQRWEDRVALEDANFTMLLLYLDVEDVLTVNPTHKI